MSRESDKRDRLIEWANEVDAQEQSGLTQREWSNLNGMSYDSFVYRRRVVKEIRASAAGQLSDSANSDLETDNDISRALELLRPDGDFDFACVEVQPTPPQEDVLPPASSTVPSIHISMLGIDVAVSSDAKDAHVDSLFRHLAEVLHA